MFPHHNVCWFFSPGLCIHRSLLTAVRSFLTIIINKMLWLKCTLISLFKLKLPSFIKAHFYQEPASQKYPTYWILQFWKLLLIVLCLGSRIFKKWVSGTIFSNKILYRNLICKTLKKNLLESKLDPGSEPHPLLPSVLWSFMYFLRLQLGQQ